MTTLFDILRDAYDDLGMLISGTATDGSTTTIVDTALKRYSTDDLRYGVVFITETTDGAAPQGEFAEIITVDPATGTLTLPSGSLTAAVGAADRYAIANNTYALDSMIRLVNRALGHIGDVPTPDESLSADSTAREYTLPSAVKGRLLQVWEAQDTQTQDRDWRQRLDWREEPGATYDLIFREPLVGGHALRLIYAAPHDRVSDPSDTINSAVPRELVVAWTVYLALKQRVRGQGDTARVQDLNDAAKMLEDARKRHRILLPSPPYKPAYVKRERWRTKYGPWLVS